MNVAKRICRIFAVGAVLFSGNAIAAKQEPLLPLLSTDIPAVCGCTFARNGSKEGPIFHWANDGKKQGVVRTAARRHVLEWRQEKHMPERAGGNPQPNDRMVLFVANGDWQVQVLGLVTSNACRAKSSCPTAYTGKLLVQQDGGPRTEIPVKGTCGCPKS